MLEICAEFAVQVVFRFIANEFNKVVRYKHQIRSLREEYGNFATMLPELQSNKTKNKYQMKSDLFQRCSQDINSWCEQTKKVIDDASEGAKPYEIIRRRKIWEAIQQQTHSLAKIKSGIPAAILFCVIVEQKNIAAYRMQPLPDTIIPASATLDKIIQLLIDKDKKTGKWIGICGMGGSGKSVLARMVNNDPRVLEHFEGRVYFLSVRRNASVRDLLRTLCQLLNFNYAENKDENEEHLKVMLYDFHREKRSLLILDDVWEGGILDGLDILDQKNGSKVLVTTRKFPLLEQKKGEIVSSKGLLSDSENKKIFSMHAFKSEEESRPELNPLVNEMAAACQGNLLALKVVGSSMTGKDKKIWEATSKKVKMEGAPGTELGSEINHLFEYSYEDLLTMKDGKLVQKCYLWMGAFEFGAKIMLEEIVALWRGDDLVPPLTVDKGEVCGLEESHRIMDVLVKRSLVEADGDGYYIHDVLAKLILDRLSSPQQEHEKGCIFLPGVAKGKRLTELFSPEANKLKDAARVSLRASDISVLPPSEIDASGVAVLLLDKNKLGQLSSSTVKSFVNLKVLSMRETTIRTLPVEICMLKQLQVLQLTNSMLEEFPQCCYDMTSLAYLDLLSSSHSVKNFKFAMLDKLSNLEVLRLSFSSFREEAIHLDTLPKLTTLELRSDDKSQGSIEICSAGKANLRNLLLHAKVANFRKVTSMPITLESCIVRVETMHGSWKTLFQPCKSLGLLEIGSLLDAVPPVQEFGANMTSFTLRGCSVLPDSVTSSTALPSLTSLVFWNCTFEELPDFDLPLLTKLEFHSCHSLCHLPHSVAQLQKLKELRVMHGGLVSKNVLKEQDHVSKVAFRELRLLDLEATRIKYLPLEVACAPKLENISVSACCYMEKLITSARPPDGCEIFASLAELNFSNSSLAFDLLPPEVRGKAGLKTICSTNE